MRRSTRLSAKANAALVMPAIPASAKFSDLPPELHLLIFNELLAALKNPKPKSDVFTKEILPLAFLCQTWRALVHEKVFTNFSLRGEQLEEFIVTVKENPQVLGFVRKLAVTSAAGDSMDRPATLLEEAERRAGLKRDRRYERSVYTDVVLKDSLPTSNDRKENLLKVWKNLEILFTLTPRKDLRISKLKISVDDTVKGKFNGDRLPQFNFLPTKDIDNYCKNFKPLPIEHLMELELESTILANIELDPQLVRTWIRDAADLNTLSLKVSDVRALRSFRREIHYGLLGTIAEISNLQNLTTFTLDYRSSHGQYQERWDRVYSLANWMDVVDELSNALRILSQRLIKFVYCGRISKHLFTVNGEEGDFWPLLQDLTVDFDAVNAFGRFLCGSVPNSDESVDVCMDCCLFAPECSGWHNCFDVDPSAQAASFDEEDALREEGWDSMICDKCLNRTYDPFKKPVPSRISRIFERASLSISQMPKIRKWSFKSRDRSVIFSFDRDKNKAKVARFWWQPNAAALSNWQMVFPGLEIVEKKHSKELADYLEEMDDSYYQIA